MRHEKTTDTKEVLVTTGESNISLIEEASCYQDLYMQTLIKIKYLINRECKIDKNEHIITRCEKLDNQWLLEVETMNFKRYFKNQPPYEKGNIVDLTIFLNYIDTLK